MNFTIHILKKKIVIFLSMSLDIISFKRYSTANNLTLKDTEKWMKTGNMNYP